MPRLLASNRIRIYSFVRSRSIQLSYFHVDVMSCMYMNEGISSATSGRVSSKAENGTAEPDLSEADIALMYVTSFYWSAMNLLSIGNQPSPQTNAEIAYHTGQTLVSVLLLATVVGNVTTLVANVDRQRVEFLAERDSIKSLLSQR